MLVSRHLTGQHRQNARTKLHDPGDQKGPSEEGGEDAAGRPRRPLRDGSAGIRLHRHHYLPLFRGPHAHLDQRQARGRLSVSVLHQAGRRPRRGRLRPSAAPRRADGICAEVAASALAARLPRERARPARDGLRPHRGDDGAGRPGAVDPLRADARIWPRPRSENCVATRPILTLENPRLRMKSVKVKRVDRSIQTLIDDMIETMRAAEGVGLAAPQVGVLLRVIVCEYADEETEELHQTVLINPEILAKEGEWMAEEGCLSIPGYVGTVPRAVRVSVKGKDRTGKDVRIKTDGPLAHILQHEIDHLDGILFIDYLKSLDELREVEPGSRRRRRRTPRVLDEETPPSEEPETGADHPEEGKAQPESNAAGRAEASATASGSAAPSSARARAGGSGGRSRARTRSCFCGTSCDERAWT